MKEKGYLTEEELCEKRDKEFRQENVGKQVENERRVGFSRWEDDEEMIKIGW